MTEGSSDAPFWVLGLDDVERQLGCRRQGLTTAEVEERLSRFGTNDVGEQATHSGWRLLWSQFESPLVLVLVFAGCVSAAMREWVDAGLVVALRRQEAQRQDTHRLGRDAEVRDGH
jgi:Mg2+-importing ATPase